MKRWKTEETQRLLQMFQEGRPYNEIAETLGKSESAIRQKIYNLRKRGIVTELLQPLYTNFFPQRTEKKDPPSKEEIYRKLVLALLTEFDRIRINLNNQTPQYMKLKPRLYNNLFRCAEALLRILKAEPEESDIDEWAEIIAEKLPSEFIEPRKLLKRWTPKRKKL